MTDFVCLKSRYFCQNMRKVCHRQQAFRESSFLLRLCLGQKVVCDKFKPSTAYRLMLSDQKRPDAVFLFYEINWWNFLFSYCFLLSNLDVFTDVDSRCLIDLSCGFVSTKFMSDLPVTDLFGSLLISVYGVRASSFFCRYCSISHAYFHFLRSNYSYRWR